MATPKRHIYEAALNQNRTYAEACQAYERGLRRAKNRAGRAQADLEQARNVCLEVHQVVATLLDLTNALDGEKGQAVMENLHAVGTGKRPPHETLLPLTIEDGK